MADVALQGCRVSRLLLPLWERPQDLGCQSRCWHRRSGPCLPWLGLPWPPVCSGWVFLKWGLPGRPSRIPQPHTTLFVFHRCHSGRAQPPASSAGPYPPAGSPRPLPDGLDAPASVAVALPSPGGPPSLAPPLHPETGALGASRQQARAPGQFCALSSLGPPAGSQSAEEQLERQQEQEVQVEADTQEKGAANPRGE